MNLKQLVCYENQGKIILGVILEISNKILLINDAGANVNLAKDRLHLIPNSSLDGNRDYIVSELIKLRNDSQKIQSEISIPDIWESLDPKDKSYSVKELCDLYFTKSSAADYLAMRNSLIANHAYFKRNNEEFIARTEEVAKQLLLQLEVEKQQRDAEKEVLSLLKRETLIISKRSERLIENLKMFAAGSEELSTNEVKTIKELIFKYCDDLKIEPDISIPRLTYDLLVAAGLINDFTNIARYRYRTPSKFSEACLLETTKLPDLNQIEEFRVDLRDLDCFTVDDESTQDMDDAISLRVLDNNQYEVGIHIADVASLIPADSEIDLEARQRATSIYMTGGNLNMLPEAISEAAASLISQETRRTISCIINCDQNFEIISSKIIPSIIEVKRRYDYDAVDLLLEQGEPEFETIYQIASSHEAHRIEAGAYISARRAIKVDILGSELILKEFDEASLARTLVSEMMVIANKLFAEFLAKNKLPAAFRVQDAPEFIQDVNDIPEGAAKDYQSKAGMKSSRTQFQPGLHWGLGLQHYLQATSPIRRYVDLMHQRQILSFFAKGSAFYDLANFKEIVGTLEDGLRRAQSLSRASERFWLLKYFEKYRSEIEPMAATVIRLEKKRLSLVNLDKFATNSFVKLADNAKLGDKIQLKISKVDPVIDELKLQLVK